MKKSQIIIEQTTVKNASKSWENPNDMISEYPIHATLEGFAGGFFKTFGEAHDYFANCLKQHGYFYKKTDPTIFDDKTYGTCIISVYTQKEVENYGWQVDQNILI